MNVNKRKAIIMTRTILEQDARKPLANFTLFLDSAVRKKTMLAASQRHLLCLDDRHVILALYHSICQAVHEISMMSTPHQHFSAQSV